MVRNGTASCRGLAAHRVQAEHHHPGDPEEQDVVRRDEHARRVEGAQVRRCRPASRGWRTATARKRTRCRGRRRPGSSPPAAVSSGPTQRTSPCSGPYQTGIRCPHHSWREMHQSCMSSTQPKYRAFISGGEISHPAVAHGVAGRLGERRDAHEPLQRQPRLDRGGAAGAVPDRVHVRADLPDDPAVLAQRGDDRRAGLEPVQALERAGRGDHAVLVHDGEHGQVVAAADLEVVRVVRRGDLDRAGAEGRVDVRVGHDRDAAAGQRQLDRLCRPGACTARRPGGRRRRCRRASSRPAWWRRRCESCAVAVADRDELALVVGVVDLDVGQRGEAARAPVDDPLGAVDQPVVVQPLEDRLDGPGQPLVHGEPLARPVHASRRGGASGTGSGRRTRPSTARPARRTPPGRGRAGTGPPWPARARRRSGWRCPRGPCRAATACGSPACGGGGRGCRSACGSARGRCAGCPLRSAAGARSCSSARRGSPGLPA